MTFLAVLVACALRDGLCLRWYRSEREGDPVRAALYSAAIATVDYGSIFLVVAERDPVLAIAAVLGHALGSGLGVRRRSGG